MGGYPMVARLRALLQRRCTARVQIRALAAKRVSRADTRTIIPSTDVETQATATNSSLKSSKRVSNSRSILSVLLRSLLLPFRVIYRFLRIRLSIIQRAIYKLHRDNNLTTPAAPCG